MMPIMVFGSAMEILLRQIPNPYKVKTAYFEKRKDSIKTLILGSSHTFYGVNPEFISNEAFNFANVSQTIDIDYKYLEFLGEQMPNLEYVIIRLSYATLYEQLGVLDENWRIKDYNIYTYNKLDFKVNHQFEIFSVKLRTNINRLLSHYVIGDYIVGSSESGWGIEPRNENVNGLNKTGELTAKKHTISDKYLYDDNLLYLNKIMSYCENRNIRVLLVTTPTYRSYYSNLEQQQLQETVEIGIEMEKKYSNCNYYNLLKSSSFTEIDFYDGDHLNKMGAKKLTKLMNQEIIKLQLNSR
jgi:hypothetical protein